ncbi:MAG: YfcC family protein, partial [Firmicutes bacterium]|nr:YfcC family protein [Bacillota bacterium]
MPTLEKDKKKKKFKVPNVYILIMGIAFCAMLLTWLVPAGAYERVANADGRMVVDPSTFQYVESTPQGLFQFFQAFHTGLVEMAGIIFFLFI